MTDEIKRNTWSRFCKRFNAGNLYRHTRLRVKQGDKTPGSLSLTPFMGVTLTRRGRFIDGIQILTAGWDADQIVEPILTINEPEKIWRQKGKTGSDEGLRIRAKDGTEVELVLTGEPEPHQPVNLVEKVAYSLYERRGYAPGQDIADWLEAEQKVRRTEQYLTR